MYEYKHPMPVVTADILVWRTTPNWPDPSAQVPPGIRPAEILLVQRAKNPYLDHWALPGGHFDIYVDESVKHCAQRELKEETNIIVKLEDLNFVSYYDQKKRDSRGRYIGFLFSYCWDDRTDEILAADDVKDYCWKPFQDIDEYKIKLAFDHDRMIREWNVSGE